MGIRGPMAAVFFCVLGGQSALACWKNFYHHFFVFETGLAKNIFSLLLIKRKAKENNQLDVRRETWHCFWNQVLEGGVELVNHWLSLFARKKPTESTLNLNDFYVKFGS
ncbi:hypothetical protein Ancab_011291 [Ancistrocladus abbreviatus]